MTSTPRPMPELDADLRRWVAADLIDDAAARRIRAHEEALETTPSTAHGRVAALFGTIGGVLVGLGFLLMVAANWSSFGHWTKLWTLVVVMLAAHAVALMADARDAARWIGTTAHAVGVLVFAASVFLLGQTFNVRAHDALGFLVVALSATAMCLLTQRRTLGWIASLAWVAWLVHELALLIEFDDSWAHVVLAITVGPLVGLGVWATAAVLDAFPAARHLGTPLRWVSLAGVTGTLLITSFFWRADAMPSASKVLGASHAALLLSAAALLIVGASGAMMRITPPRLGEHARLGALVPTVLGAAIVAAALAGSPVLVGVISSVSLAVIGMLLALLGITRNDASTYASGVSIIIALIAARYIDMLVELGLGGLAFLGGGVLFILLAWLVARSRGVWLRRTRRNPS